MNNDYDEDYPYPAFLEDKQDYEDEEYDSGESWKGSTNAGSDQHIDKNSDIIMSNQPLHTNPCLGGI